MFGDDPVMELYYVRNGSRIYGTYAEAESLAIIDVLAFIRNPDLSPEDCEAWIARNYHERYGGEPAKLNMIHPVDGWIMNESDR